MTLLNKQLISYTNWYGIIYLGVIVSSFILRVIELDARTVHYDEAIHLMASFKLITEGVYEHSAWMHGPLQIEMVSWIFKIAGDSLFSGRILYVIFGTGLVCLPVFLREHIGRKSSLLMAFLLSISPTLVYMSRFGRNDIIMAFLSLLLFILAYKYILSGKFKLLFLIAGTLAIIFSTKETSYFIAATMAGVLVAAIIWSAVSKSPGQEKSRVEIRLWDLLILLVGLILPLSAALTGFFQTYLGVTLVATEGTEGTLTGALGNGNPWVNIQDLIHNPVLTIIPVVILSVIALSIFTRSTASTGKKAVIFSLLLAFSLYAYINSAIGDIHNSLLVSIMVSSVMMCFSVYWSKYIKNLFTRSAFLYCAFAIGAHHVLICTGASLIPGMARLILPGTPVFNEFITLSSLITLIIIVGFYSVSLTIGIYRFSYKWLLMFTIFTGILLITYTTYFTNSQGFYTGIWQSLGYWMAQQEVARGNQPWYYYFVGLSIYEFLPVIFGIAGVFWSIKTKNILGSLFSLWAISSIVFFTIASEKMPWLLTYTALPLSLASAIFIGSLLDTGKTIAFKTSEYFLLSVCCASIFLILITIIAINLSFLIILFLTIIALVFAFIAATLIRNIESKFCKPAILLPVAGILIVLTLTNTYFLNYRNDDSLKQFMIYAQGSHELSQYFTQNSKYMDANKASTLLTSIDYDIWYPMHWYVRNNDINGSIEFRCFKQHGDPEWNETCLSLNDINKKQNFLVSEIHHPLYQSQSSSKIITGPVYNILWFPEIYRRPGENRINETLSEELKLDYMYFSNVAFDPKYWLSLRDYLFFRNTTDDWFHADFYIYEQTSEH